MNASKKSPDPGSAQKCADCVDGLDHCHGTLLIHRDGTGECTDAACREHEQTRHDLVADCCDIVPACGCTGT